MGQMGTCCNCEAEWHSKVSGYLVLPALLPIDSEGSTFGAVCQMCAQDLAPEKVGELTLKEFGNASGKMPLERIPGFADTPRVSEAAAAIRKWVERQH